MAAESACRLNETQLLHGEGHFSEKLVQNQFLVHEYIAE